MFLPKLKTIIVLTEEDMEGKTEEEIEMMKLMGFGSFNTSKVRARGCPMLCSHKEVQLISNKVHCTAELKRGTYVCIHLCGPSRCLDLPIYRSCSLNFHEHMLNDYSIRVAKIQRVGGLIMYYWHFPLPCFFDGMRKVMPLFQNSSSIDKKSAENCTNLYLE